MTVVELFLNTYDQKSSEFVGQKEGFLFHMTYVLLTGVKNP